MGKVFLSYSQKDQDFVKKLYRRLTGNGVCCFFDKESNFCSDDRALDLEDGLNQCDKIVLVLSPDFCSSEWTKIESSDAIMNDPAGLRRKLRPLILKPCEKDISWLIRGHRHIDVSTVDKFEEEYPMICAALGGNVEISDRPADRNGISYDRQPPKSYGMPCRPLNFMSVKEAHELLNSGAREFGREAEKLIDTLGGFVLALEVARAVLNRRPTLTIEDMMLEIKAVREIQTLILFAEKYIDDLPIDNSKEVVAMFKICWDLAPPTAKSVLQSMSLLGPEPVPRGLLQDILDIPSKTFTEDPLDQAIRELTSQLFLAGLDDENDPRVDSLLSAFVRETTIVPGHLPGRVHKAVVSEMARLADECDNHAVEELDKILPHAELLAISESVNADHAMDLLNYLCMHSWKRRRFRSAERQGRKAMEFADRHYEPGHPRIATSQSNLGEVLRSLGELEESRDLLRQALESDEKSYEPRHPVIAIRQSVLALVLRDLGEVEEARDLLRQALESDEKNFTSGHLKIAIRQSNLAAVLNDLGELEEARDLAGQAYRNFLDNLGPEHSYTKTAKTNWESI